MRHPAPVLMLATLFLAGALWAFDACACAPQALRGSLGLLFVLLVPASGWVAALRLRDAWVAFVLTLGFSLVIDTLVALLLSYFGHVEATVGVLLLAAVALAGQAWWWLSARREGASGKASARAVRP